MAKKLEYTTDYLFNYNVIDSVNDVIDEASVLKDSVNGLIDNSNVLVKNVGALDYWFSSYADALNEPVFINWVGDSLTFGTTTETDSTNISNIDKNKVSAAGQLSKIFANMFGTVEGGLITPYFTGLDSRVTRSAGMANSTTSGPLGMVGRSDSNGAYVEFSVPSCKYIDFLYYNNTASPHTGSFKYKVDAGSDVLVPLSGPFNVNKSLRTIELSQSTHTFRATRDDANNANYWQGVRYHNGVGVTVCRLGRPGWTTSDALGFGSLNAGANADGQARLALGVHAGSPALTILSFGQNDMGKQLADGTTPAQYKINLQKMINQASGSVMLLSTPNQTYDGTPDGGASLEAYWDVCSELADENANVCHVKLSDIFTPNGNADRSVALGYYASGSSIHQSSKGYGAWARLIYQVLTSKAYAVRY